MSDEEEAAYTRQRQQLHDAFQKLLDEHEDGAYVIGWLCIMEVAAPNGEKWLLTRTGNANGGGLNSWQGLGYLHSAIVDFEDQSRSGRVDAEEDDDWMAAGEHTPGRRRDDLPFGDLPEDFQPGDYWRYLDRETGETMRAVDAPDNLTGTVWGFYAPNGCGIGLLMKHTVRENEDGTATIARGDGSSNSVLIHGADESWHGYLDAGVWREV